MNHDGGCTFRVYGNITEELGTEEIWPHVALSLEAAVFQPCTTLVPRCRRLYPRGRSSQASCTIQRHCPCTLCWTDLTCLQVFFCEVKLLHLALSPPVLSCHHHQVYCSSIVLVLLVFFVLVLREEVDLHLLLHASPVVCPTVVLSVPV